MASYQTDKDALELDDLPPDYVSSRDSVKDSVNYAEKLVTQDLHPAFADSRISYDPNNDCFAAEEEDTYDESVLFDNQRAFADALEQFQQGVKPKYKSQIDLQATHTWSEVMKQADEARSKYTGVGQQGVIKRINHGLKSFQTAAPAIQAWLKLLPSNTTYGSIICGGLTVILEAAVNLRKLRKETLNALDQMPLCIEKAEFFMRTYGYIHVHQQTGNLYLAIINALQHILEWYKSAASKKYLGAFCKGPAYAEKLREKMENVEKASQAMNEQASQRKDVRLKEIRNVTVQTKDQVGELKILAVEARNHLYAVFKDTEVWQEALQKKTREARKALLMSFGPHKDDPARDVETALGKLTSLTLGDQDRTGAIIQHDSVQEWILHPRFGTLLVHGNGQRHDPISSTSVACAMLVHIFAKRLQFPTLYWFCGLHISGPGSSALEMMQSLVCQLLCLSCCECSLDDQEDLDTQDLDQLLKLFTKLLRRSSVNIPIVCIIDGISYYESRYQIDKASKIVRKLSKLARANPPILMLLISSPIRTSQVCRDPKIAGKIIVTEIPVHISGSKQGLNHREMVSSTEKKARKMSESLGLRNAQIAE